MEEQTASSDQRQSESGGESAAAETNKDAPEPTIEGLQAALTQAEEKMTASQDQFLRAVAELDNFRKRAGRDIEHARKYGIEGFAAELLQVRDSLELGLAAEEASIESLHEGSEMTLRLFSQVMEKFGIVQIDPQGEVFDPLLHEAMVAVPSEAAPNTIIEVVQKGYQINDRLLRPARVVVAKAAEENSGDTA
ncbi:MAG: nucleotide exchange factor GrpE [Gammaproteobacteria bacterium]|nr:nucleotide exchange factor GrpE [Gammaproteobacteria bacterium]